MKSKRKKVLGVFKDSFLRNVLGGGHRFFNFIKEGLVKNSLGNPVVEKFLCKI